MVTGILTAASGADLNHVLLTGTDTLVNAYGTWDYGHPSHACSNIGQDRTAGADDYRSSVVKSGDGTVVFLSQSGYARTDAPCMATIQYTK
jgi:hypothetical protein